MKTKKKAMLLAVSAILIVIATAFSTMAYLTSEATIAHTFTVGDVNATVLTDQSATLSLGDDTLVKDGQILKLIPNNDYFIPVSIEVDSNSEEAWVFVQIINPLEPIEAAHGAEMSAEFEDFFVGDVYHTIEEQMAMNCWVPLTDSEGEELHGVYYYDETPDDVNTGHAVGSGWRLDLYNCFKVTHKAVKGTVEENNAEIIAEADEKAARAAAKALKDGEETDEAVTAAPEDIVLLTEDEEKLCLGEYDGDQITVIVYIVQADGIPTVDLAWEVFADKYAKNLEKYSEPETSEIGEGEAQA